MENLNKQAINNGIIIAVIGLAMQILPYYAAPQLLGNTMFGIAVGIITLVIYIFFTLDLRKKNDGFWSFKDALKGIFIMSLIANVGTSVFNYVFYKFIEPGAFDKVVGIVSESMAATYEKMGMSQDLIDQAMEKVVEGLKSQYQPSPLDFIKNLGIIILGGFVISLIFAAIFKKNTPIFAPIEEAE